MASLNHLLILSLTCIGQVACVSNGYRVVRGDYDIKRLIIDSEHAVVECERLENGNAGMMIHVLEAKKTFFTLLGYQHSVGDCGNLKREIDKLRASRSKIEIVVSGDLDEPKRVTQSTMRFGRLGEYPGDSRVLRYVGVRIDDQHCLGNKASGEWCTGDY